MLSVPVKINEGQFDLFVVLQDENVKRIHEYDPAEVVKQHLGNPWDKMAIRNVIVTYASPADMATIMPMFVNGDVRGALRHLSRGFRYRPESGDHDRDYESLKREQ